MSRFHAIFVACLAVLMPAQVVIAQSLMVSPRRLIRLFDFEETNDAGVKIGRGIPMPRGWYVVGRDPLSEKPNFLGVPLHQQLADRPGYPPHGQVGYDDTQAASGDYALGLTTQGGNAGTYLAVGSLAAVPRSDYLVTAKIRTDGLLRSGAVLIAYYVDADGQRIEQSVRRSIPQRSPDGWSHLDLKLPGQFRGAAFVGIEAHIVQPTPDPDHALGQQQIVIPDVAGTAWFDDIAVWQLPSISIRTQSDANLIRAPERPRVAVNVRDLIGQRLTARVTAYDLHRQPVATEQRTLVPGSPAAWEWTPDLPGYGWYLTELAVFDAPNADATPVARTYGAFVHLPPEPAAVGPDARRFALDARGVPEDQLALLPQIVDATHLRTVAVSAWDRNTTLLDAPRRAERLDQIMSSALGTGDRLIVSFQPVPYELETTDGVNTDESLTALTAEPRRWMPFAQPILSRMGQWVFEWQLGDETQPAVPTADWLAAALPPTRDALEQWTPKPTLRLPASLLIETDRSQDATLNLARWIDWPNAVTPDALQDHLQPPNASTPAAPTNRSNPGTHADILLLDLPTADQLPHPERVADLTLRVLSAWELDRPLDQPLDLAIGPRWTRAQPIEKDLAAQAAPTTVLPDPALGVFANLTRRLAGRRITGQINLGPGLQCLVLEPIAQGQSQEAQQNQDPSQTGALVVWNQSSPPEGAFLQMYLGPKPAVVDVWGNRTPIPQARGKHRVELGKIPVFIEGIDLPLAKFRASFQLDEPFIPSTQVPHQRAVRFTNPWPMTINGRFTFTGPRSWTLNPQRQVFALAPGASVELPVAMSFPVNEPAGDHRLTARFEFTADRDYTVDLSAPVGLGLENVRFEASLFVDRVTNPGQADVVVTCILTNVGPDDLSLNVFASLLGHPYRERIVPRLEPGQAAIRTFRFENAGPAAAAYPLLAGVRETNGPAVLNKHLRLGRDQ